MATARARYKGYGAGIRIPDFSQELRASLRCFYPDIETAVSDPPWGHPADAFVEHILSEAWQAKSGLNALQYETTKSEIKAEQSNLLKSLVSLESNLRNLSLGFDRLLDIDSDPLGCADQIATLITHVKNTESKIQNLPKSRRPVEKELVVVTEMSVGVLRALQGYGILASATADPDHGRVSDAVKILKLIGDDIGFVRGDTTWKDIVRGAKPRLT